MKQFIDKLIERLEEHKTKAYVTGFTNNPYELGACHAMDDAVKIVNLLAEEHKDDIQTIDVSELLGESEQVNDGWISVEDKLPEDTHSVLIITKANTIWTAFYDKEYDEWRDDVDERILSVIAWHEIPAFCRAKG
jgi:hypothetical protein